MRTFMTIKCRIVYTNYSFVLMLHSVFAKKSQRACKNTRGVNSYRLLIICKRNLYSCYFFTEGTNNPRRQKIWSRRNRTEVIWSIPEVPVCFHFRVKICMMDKVEMQSDTTSKTLYGANPTPKPIWLLVETSWNSCVRPAWGSVGVI